MKNLFCLRDLSVEEIIRILDVAKECKAGKHIDACKGKIAANLFFEPSTRTQYSFQVAQAKLGFHVISFNPGASSLSKGESFYDTVKTFSSFGVDAIVIRDRQDEYYKQLESIKTPILSGGDGKKDHPTQSLLDLMTIREQFGHFEGLKIAIVGDVKYSRVAHTNIEVMERLGMKCYISGPEEYREDEYEYIDFETALKEMDIIMLLRVQHERHESEMQITKAEYHECFGLTKERVQMMKENAIIMHPAPFNRGVEIADDVVECEKSRIFNQIENGVFVRMAVMMRSLED